MKKIIAILVILSVLTTVFAAVSTSTSTSSSAELSLALADAYEFAFTDSESAVLDSFVLKTAGDALNRNLNLDETQNIFYFYYKAYTGETNLKIKFNATNHLTTSGGDQIKYLVKLDPVSGYWDAAGFSTAEFESGNSSEAIIRSSTLNNTVFNFYGKCKVIIDDASGVNLWEKKPGNYNATIYLELSTT